MKIPKVSVCMVTYNQEEFISEAIHGVSIQNTDFEYGLIIGDDCSTDTTRDVISEFQARVPGLIKLRVSDRNIGVISNYAETLANCVGEYIALCDGDDYWTDPFKLKKQVEFLEKNKEYTLCAHETFINIDGKLIDFDCESTSDLDLTFDMFLTGNRLGRNCCSVVFRRSLCKHILALLPFFPYLDWLTYLVCSANGKIMLLNERMAVYRIHEKGVWSGLSQADRQTGLKSMLVAILHFFELTEEQKTNVLNKLQVLPDLDLMFPRV